MSRHSLLSRYTIYDSMEARGVFAKNPANMDSHSENGESLYTGPVEYPKMFYHPLGKEEILRPAHQEASPVGPITVPAVVQVINKIAKNEDDEKRLRQHGWHDHPAKALRAKLLASGLSEAEVDEIAPKVSAGETIDSLRRQIAKLQAELAKEKRAMSSDDLGDLRVEGVKPLGNPLAFVPEVRVKEEVPEATPAPASSLMERLKEAAEEKPTL